MIWYLAIAGVGLLIAVLGLALRNVSNLQVGVPAWMAGLVSGLLIGGAVGLGGMFIYGRTELTRSTADGRLSGEQGSLVSSSGQKSGGDMGGTSGGTPKAGGMGMGGGGMGGGGMGGGGMGGGGMGGGGMGGGGMGGGGMGGGGGMPGVAPARGVGPLLTFVQKLNQATRGSVLELSREQQHELAELLAPIDDPLKISDPEGQAKLEAIQAILTDEQKEILDRRQSTQPADQLKELQDRLKQ